MYVILNGGTIFDLTNIWLVVKVRGQTLNSSSQATQTFIFQYKFFPVWVDGRKG